MASEMSMDSVFNSGGLFVYQEDNSRSLTSSVGALSSLVLGLLAFSAFSLLFIAFAVCILSISIGPLAAGVDEGSAQTRWLYVSLISLSVPTSVFLFLYWGQKYSKSVFANWLPILKWRYEKDKEAVIHGISPHLGKDEEIIGHLQCEELFKDCPMWSSFFFIALLHMLLFFFAFIGGFWASVEVFNAAVVMPVMYFILLLIVWLTDATNTLDRASSMFIQMLLTGLTLALSAHVYKIEAIRFLVVFTIVAQVLLLIWKFVKFRPSSFLVLTNKRLLYAKTKMSLSPSPCYLPFNPASVKKHIECGPSQFGEQWLINAGDEDIVCYPMFVSLDKLAALSRKSGVALKVKKSQKKQIQSMARKSFLFVLLWAVFLNIFTAPLLHYMFTLEAHLKAGYARDRTLRDEEAAAFRVMAKHHPTAILPGLKLANYHIANDEPKKAFLALKSTAELMIHVPESIRKTNETCRRAEKTFIKLMGLLKERKKGPHDQK